MNSLVVGLLVMGLSAACGCRRNPPRPDTAPAAKTPISPTEIAGAQRYVRYCALCHGAHAEGYAADNAPSLVSPTFAATASDEFLRAGIAWGRPGTAMAGYSKAIGGPLDPAEIDSLIAYLHIGAPPPVALSTAPIAGDPVKGQTVYVTRCASCHGTPTQRGNSVHLANALLLSSAGDSFLRYAVAHGRPGTRMEAWEGKLDPSSIDNVVAYLRSLMPSGTALATTALATTTRATTTLATTMSTTVGMEPALPVQGPIVINPKGQAPTFDLREDRFASLVSVKQALDKRQRIVIVDARPPSDWLRLHIPGSISIPYYDLKAIDDLPKDGTWIIAYCACPHHASGVVVDELRKRDFKHSAVLDEGVFAWQHAGYPVIAAPGTLPVPAPPVSPGALSPTAPRPVTTAPRQPARP